MAAMHIKTGVAPENLRLMLLAYGMEHPYRVLALEEIFHSLPGVDRDKIKGILDRLATEGLVTRFASRYCFNRSIPEELRRHIERALTPSGTMKVVGVKE